MKNKFGEIKSKLLKKVTDLYEENNKKDLKDILSIINEDKNFKELYLFYEELENLNVTYPGSAEVYVETITPLLSDKIKSINETTKKLNKYIKDVIIEENQLYNNLDKLIEEDTIFNIHEKVISKQKLVEHLKKEKTIETEEIVESYTHNEKLLAAILANNFNVLYGSSLNENEKLKLKEILSLSTEDIKVRIDEMKNEVLNKIEKILSESVDNQLNEKLSTVKKEIINTSPTKLNYYKLTELKNGLV